MQTKCSSIILLIFTFSYVACAPQTQQNSEECNNDTILAIKENKEFDKELIISLIKKDEGKRNICSYDVKESASSPLFFEAICDDGLYLYRVVVQYQQTFVIMIDDENIGTVDDFIDIENNGPYGKDGVEYEHKGYYEIIDDSTVNVLFEKRWKNYCYICDSCEQEFTYHIKCTHGYKLSNMAFERVKADTISVVDERPLFCCEDTLMNLLGLH